MRQRVVLVLESNPIIQPMQRIKVLIFIIDYDNQSYKFAHLTGY